MRIFQGFYLVWHIRRDGEHLTRVQDLLAVGKNEAQNATLHDRDLFILVAVGLYERAFLQADSGVLLSPKGRTEDDVGTQRQIRAGG